MRLNAQQLRELKTTSPPPNIKRWPLSLILDNVYDTYNIGGLFRLADALAMEKIYLCGQTETPPNSKITKASIGTYKIVPWEYQKTAVSAIQELKTKPQPCQIIAIEQDPTALPYHQMNYQPPVALVVGNETAGVSKEVLKQCDYIVEIPMFGVNKSLNVIVSAAIVGYHISLQSFNKL